MVETTAKAGMPFFQLVQKFVYMRPAEGKSGIADFTKYALGVSVSHQLYT